MTANPPKDRRLTAAEFWQMIDAGAVDGRRAELINGEVVPMSPSGGFHFAYADCAADALRAAFGPGFWVRVQGTLDLAALSSVVDPDVSVVTGTRAENMTRLGNNNPTTAVLIVESSYSTLGKDRVRKASLYAAAGVLDYWILDVAGRRLEVRRDPWPDPAAEFGHGYATLTVHAPGEAVAPLARPGAPVAVADLFPV